MNKHAHNPTILSCIELSRNSIQAIKSKIKKRRNERRYVKIACNWTWNGANPTVWLEFQLTSFTSIFILKRWNFLPVTERLTPSTIGKFTLSEEKFMFQTWKLISFLVNWVLRSFLYSRFCNFTCNPFYYRMINEEIKYYHTINYITYWRSPQLKYSI